MVFSTVLPHVTEGWKKVVSGICFTGAGAAIVMVSLLLPTFTALSVTAGWLFEAGLTFGFAALAWRLASEAPGVSAETGSLSIPPRAEGVGVSLALLGAAYFLAALSSR